MSNITTMAANLMTTSTAIVNPTIQSISVADDGSIWAVDRQGQVLQCTEGSQPWTAVPANVAMSALAVSDTAGLVFALADGAPYFACARPNASWRALPALSAHLVTIAAGAGDAGSFQLWATDANGALWSYSAATAAWSGAGVQAQQVVATSDGAVYRLTAGQVFSYDASQSTWAQLPAPEPVTNVGAGAQSYLWIVGESGSIYQFDPGQGNSWSAAGKPPATGVTLSVGDDAAVWLVAGGALYQYDAHRDGWSAVTWTGAAAPAQVSLANLGQAWALDMQGHVYQYTEFADEWNAIAGSGLPALGRVSATDAATLWGTDGSGGVYKLTAGATGWQSVTVAGAALVLVSAGSDGTVWGVDRHGAAYALVDGSFVLQTAQPALGLVAVGAADQIVGIDDSGTIVRWEAGSGAWLPLDAPNGPFSDLCIDAHGQMWALNRTNKLFTNLGPWIEVSAAQLKSISCASTGEVWGISTQDLPVKLSAADPYLEALPARTGGMPRWDTEDPYNETQSTHLWIVNRAAQLAQGEGAAGRQVYALAKPFQKKLGDAFHDALCEGLYAADFDPSYNDPAYGRPTYASHFYDPDTGQNYLHISSPTALTRGTKYFHDSVAAYQRGDLRKAGFKLGLALHYLTDLTQPMHAANYTYLSSWKWGYHTDFEAYVMVIQGTIQPPTTFVPSSLGTEPDEYFKTAARNSKSRYYDKICTTLTTWSYDKYTPYCKEIANKYAPAILSDAITITSQFLVAWMLSAAPNAASGKPWHTIRFANRKWQRVWGDVEAATGSSPGPFKTIACAGTDQGMQLVGLDEHGTPWHVIRIGEGSWSANWLNVGELLSNKPEPFMAIACAGLDHGMQLVGLDEHGMPWHTMRCRNGTWQSGWGNVSAGVSGQPGPFQAIACAGADKGMHLVGLAEDGTPWHTIRFFDGTWQTRWKAINPTNQPGAFQAIACAGTDGGLQLIALDADGAPWHTLRTPDERWSPWAAVNAQMSNRPGPFTKLACAATNVGMQLVVLDARGEPWHTIRAADGRWSPEWGYVDGQMKNIVGRFQSCACAGGPILQLIGLSA